MLSSDQQIRQCVQDKIMGTVLDNIEQNADPQLCAEKLDEYFKAQQHAIIAYSGGVDSALAAVLLKRAGHRIHGLHFVLPSPDDITQQRISRIREISEYLKIPLEILDLRATFEKELIEL